MTRTQKRNLANFVLAYGYDNVCEFYDDYVERTDADLPGYAEARPVLFAWHARIIELADLVAVAS